MRFFTFVLVALLVSPVQPAQVQTAACPDLEFETDRARPLMSVAVTGIPDDFGDSLLVHVNLPDEPEAGFAFITASAGGSPVMTTPVHPSLSIGGGEVTLEIDDGERRCPAVAFHIEALPAAPGTIRTMVDSLEEFITEFAALLDLTPSALRSMDIDAADPHVQPLILLSRLVLGDGELPPMREALDREAPENRDLTDEEWEFLEALIANGPRGDTPLRPPGGGPGGGMGYLRPRAPEPIRLASAHLTLSASDLAEPATRAASLMCTGPFYRPDAAALAVMMDVQILSNSIKHMDEAWMLDAASLALGAGGVLAKKSGVVPLAAVYGKVAGGITVWKNTINVLDGMFPTELIDLHVNEYKAEFFEDEEPDGRWSDALLTAASTGLDLGPILAGMVWSRTGGALADEFIDMSGFFSDVLTDVGLGSSEYVPGLEVIQSVLIQQVSQIAGSEIGGAAAGGPLQIPPCSFGPVDITEEMYSQSSILLTDAPPVAERISHQDYRMVDVGSDRLRVETPTSPPVFGPNPLNNARADLPLYVLPIYVRVLVEGRGTALPDRTIFVEPGEVLDMSAVVEYAVDESVEWTVAAPMQHEYSADEHSLVIATSENRDAFPIIIVATSTSTTGLRALPDAPPRQATVRIEAEEEEELITCPMIDVDEVGPCAWAACLLGPTKAVVFRGDVGSYRLPEDNIGRLVATRGLAGPRELMNFRAFIPDPQPGVPNHQPGFTGNVMGVAGIRPVTNPGRFGTPSENELTFASRDDHPRGELTFSSESTPTDILAVFDVYLRSANVLQHLHYRMSGAFRAGPACME